MSSDTVYYVCEGRREVDGTTFKWFVKEIARKNAVVLERTHKRNKKLIDELNELRLKVLNPSLADFKKVARRTRAVTSKITATFNLRDSIVFYNGRPFDGYFKADGEKYHPGDIIEKNSVKIEPMPAKRQAQRLT